MKCPKCDKAMLRKTVDTSYSFKTGGKYKRTVYVCKKDDIWIRLEIPDGKMNKKTKEAIMKKRK